ncbi:hypothetical protein D3C71_1285320 [compost metagenome]
MANHDIAALQVTQIRLTELHLKLQRPLIHLRLVNPQLAHFHVRLAVHLQVFRQQIAMMSDHLHHFLPLIVGLFFPFGVRNDNQRPQNTLCAAGAFTYLPHHALAVAAALFNHIH